MQLNLTNLFHQNVPVSAQNATDAIFAYPQIYYNNSMADVTFVQAYIHIAGRFKLNTLRRKFRLLCRPK